MSRRSFPSHGTGTAWSGCRSQVEGTVQMRYASGYSLIGDCGRVSIVHPWVKRRAIFWMAHIKLTRSQVEAILSSRIHISRPRMKC